MNVRILTIGLALVVTLMSCGEKDAAVRNAARESLPNRPASNIFAESTTNGTQVSGVLHYICPNNCENGGGAVQGDCPVCGTTLAHNEAYHNQPSQVTPPDDTPEILTANDAIGTNSVGVYHYICPDGHAGGGAGEGACAQCGKALVHNQAYHDAPPATTPSAASGPAVGNVLDNVTLPTPDNLPEPAQNLAGVWHYTCNNGCAGGAGSAIACTNCGSTLAHNAAYHN